MWNKEKFNKQLEELEQSKISQQEELEAYKKIAALVAEKATLEVELNDYKSKFDSVEQEKSNLENEIEKLSTNPQLEGKAKKVYEENMVNIFKLIGGEK